jgi:uncharacterized protein DUF222
MSVGGGRIGVWQASPTRSNSFVRCSPRRSISMCRAASPTTIGCSALGALEAFGRLLDAHRAAFAGEVAERSRPELGGQRLSARKGCHSVAELIERVTQVSGAEARRRVTIGGATRARDSFTGERLGAEHPYVASALAEGDLGLDVAAVIVRELGRARVVADPVRLDAAE